MEVRRKIKNTNNRAIGGKDYESIRSNAGSTKWGKS